jgi:hypothetical protein
MSHKVNNRLISKAISQFNAIYIYILWKPFSLYILIYSFVLFNFGRYVWGKSATWKSEYIAVCDYVKD